MVELEDEYVDVKAGEAAREAHEERKEMSMGEAAIKDMVGQLTTIGDKIQYVETHLESCMSQFKYMADRFHDNIKHIAKTNANVVGMQSVIDDILKRMEPLAPIHTHCNNSTCKRKINPDDKKCGVCGREQ